MTVTWGFATPGLALAGFKGSISWPLVSCLHTCIRTRTLHSGVNLSWFLRCFNKQLPYYSLTHHAPSCTTPPRHRRKLTFLPQCRELLLQVAPDALEARVCLAATPELLLPARATAAPKATARHRDMEVLRAVLKDTEPLKATVVTPELLLSDRPTCRDITRSLLPLLVAEAALDK